MNSEKKKWLGIALLAIPFLAMVWMIGVNLKNEGYKEYRFEIEGYDPRDLLKGHYLIFRYKWPEDAQYPLNKHPPDACACFNDDPAYKRVTFALCPDKESMAPEVCPAFIKVARNGSSFQPQENMRRYYLPEEHAPMVENMLRDGKYKFEIGLAPLAGGSAQIRMLYIDGVPLDEFLKGDLTPYLSAP